MPTIDFNHLVCYTFGNRLGVIDLLNQYKKNKYLDEIISTLEKYKDKPNIKTILDNLSQ